MARREGKRPAALHRSNSVRPENDVYILRSRHQPRGMSRSHEKPDATDSVLVATIAYGVTELKALAVRWHRRRHMVGARRFVYPRRSDCLGTGVELHTLLESTSGGGAGRLGHERDMYTIKRTRNTRWIRHENDRPLVPTITVLNIWKNSA